MRGTNLAGLYEDKGFLWTENKVPGHSTYGERLRKAMGREFRHWNPFRSKLCALATKDPQTQWPDLKGDVLYLGASTGTTVSHVSDLTQGTVFAVEFSPRSVRDLLWNVEPRGNVVPILEDAGRPERYAAYIARPVATLLQDVAQRHQVDIFLRNVPFVQKGGLGYLFVKARSINVAESPLVIYKEVERRLTEAGLQILRQVDLEPFEQDHRAFVVRIP
ncbi:MAG: fibrillarin-like rRNA/tRNA 2'-O-methyltransferase [Candidatus Thermoplasmatota archaeon]